MMNAPKMIDTIDRIHRELERMRNEAETAQHLPTVVAVEETIGTLFTLRNAIAQGHLESQAKVVEENSRLELTPAWVPDPRD